MSTIIMSIPVLLVALFLLPLAHAEPECEGNDCPTKVNSLLQSANYAFGSQKELEQARCTFTSAIVGSIAGHNLEPDLGSGYTMETCQQECNKEPLCKSIDFQVSNGGCTLGDCQIGDGVCTNDNDANYKYSACVVEATPAKLTATTAPPTPLHFMLMGFNRACDESAGEVLLASEVYSDVDLCEKACEADSNCQSITYFSSSGMCKRYSTACMKMVKDSAALTLKLVGQRTTTTTTTRHFILTGFNRACDESAGEVLLASEVYSDVVLCEKACEADSNCQSLTYFSSSGMCKRYSTACMKIVKDSAALTLRLKMADK